MKTTSTKQFLKEKFPTLLLQLNPNKEPTFGLMTPQHMIEHLVWVIKTSIKDHGEAINPPTDKQLAFQKFIKKGAILKHRPTDKTKADLPKLRYDNIEKALAQIPIAVDRFYNHIESNKKKETYHPFFGVISFDDLEFFHAQHCRYHLWQFGLLETYP